MHSCSDNDIDPYIDIDIIHILILILIMIHFFIICFFMTILVIYKFSNLSLGKHLWSILLHHKRFLIKVNEVVYSGCSYKVLCLFAV